MPPILSDNSQSHTNHNESDNNYYNDDEMNRPTSHPCCCRSCPCCTNGKYHPSVTISDKTKRYIIISLILSICYWIVLYIVAASYNPGDHRFTLTVGETWQIKPPTFNLWARKSLEIRSFQAEPSSDNNMNETTNRKGGGIEVYEFLPVLDYNEPAPCPPLTLGDDPSSNNDNDSYANTLKTPIVTLHESAKIIDLDMAEYQYDYFHMNQGSIIEINAALVHPPHLPDNQDYDATDIPPGSTNIYILQGFHTLEELETTHKNKDVSGIQDFRGKSILKRYLGHGGSTTIDYTVPTSDYYIIVYDNAGPGTITAHLQVSITVTMATHYMPGNTRKPICHVQDTAVKHGCEWRFTNDQDRQRVLSTCIIVKAVSPQLQKQVQKQNYNDIDGGNEDSPAATIGASTSSSALPAVDLTVDESQVVIVQVNAPIGSFKLIILAILPIIIVTTSWCLKYGQQCIQYICSGNISRYRNVENKTMSSYYVTEQTPLNNRLRNV